MPNPTVSPDVGTLNITAQAAMRAMFWGAITLAAIIPIAAAAGTVVAEKITGDRSKKKGSSRHG